MLQVFGLTGLFSQIIMRDTFLHQFIRAILAHKIVYIKNMQYDVL